MKRVVNSGSHIERLKSWTNGVVVFAIATLGSLGSIGTSSCLNGSCGSGCGFKCIAFSTLAVVLACLKCKKKKRQQPVYKIPDLRKS